jgi:hypothetical protein
MIQAILFVVGIFIILSFLAGTLLWIGVRALGLIHSEGERVWDATDVQARVVTKGDNPKLARLTANIASKYFDDIHIVTDESMAAPPNCEIDVVPDSFDSVASNKGRALDWAQKNIECDKEYILYLDEDTKVTGFEGLPDADIVQFLEHPRKTDSILSTLIEVGRVGYQEEVKGFPKLNYPPYLWGGGFAVRSSVEDDIGWEFDSVTEDTVFLWKVMKGGYSYEVTRQRFSNQAPVSVKELIKQRRRWFAGSADDMSRLPLLSRTVLRLRLLFAISPVLTFVAFIAVSLIATPIWVFALLSIGILLWSVFGAIHYEYSFAYFLAAVFLFPILHTINAIGALYGIVSHPDGFEVTKKD